MKTDVTEFDPIRQNYIKLNSTYKSLNNNSSVDPFDKLLGKNSSVNDDYLNDLVFTHNKSDLKTCNFMHDTAPRLKDELPISNSSYYSKKRLDSLSPCVTEMKYDNDDAYNDYTPEVDIRYDLNKMRYSNMDYSYLQYMATRGPNNAENGYFDWAKEPNFSDSLYKNTDKKRLTNILLSKETDGLNKENAFSSGLSSSQVLKENLDTKRGYDNIRLSDIEFQRPFNSYTYSTSDKYNHYKGLTGSINNVISSMPTEKVIEYTSYLKKTDRPSKFKQFNTDAEVDLPYNKYDKVNYGFNRTATNPDSDVHIRDMVKNTLHELLYNDMNDLSINHNRKSYQSNKEVFTTTNRDYSDSFKDNKEQSIYKHHNHVKNLTINYLRNYNTDIKEKYKDSKFMPTPTSINLHQLDKNDKKIYQIIKEEYSNLKDSQSHNLIPKHNYFNHSNITPYELFNKKQTSEVKKFNYIDYINRNDKAADMNLLIDPKVNRSKFEDEALYEESNDNYMLNYHTKGPLVNKSYSNIYRKNISFG